MEKGQIYSLVQKYFPQDQWENAMKVIQGESGFNPQAKGDDYPIRGVHAPSYGLFQIRALPGRPAPEQLTDPEFNVRYASELFRQQGWRPWTAARKLGLVQGMPPKQTPTPPPAPQKTPTPSVAGSAPKVAPFLSGLLQKANQWGADYNRRQSEILDRAMAGDRQAQKELVSVMPMLTIQRVASPQTARAVKELVPDSVIKETKAYADRLARTGQLPIEEFTRLDEIANEVLRIPRKILNRMSAQEIVSEILSLATPNQQFVYEELPRRAASPFIRRLIPR